MQEETKTNTNETKPPVQEVERTMKVMKQELIDLGMTPDQANNFNSKSQVQAVIDMLKSQPVKSEQPSEIGSAETTKPVERVKTLDEPETPAEKRETEKRYRNKAQIMRDKLMSQPQVRTILPLAAGEKPGVVEWRTDKYGEKYQVHISGTIDSVQLNGCKWLIPKGVPCNIPQQVSDELDNSYLQTQRAGADISMDRIDPRTGRTMSDSL